MHPRERLHYLAARGEMNGKLNKIQIYSENIFPVLGVPISEEWPSSENASNGPSRFRFRHHDTADMRVYSFILFRLYTYHASSQNVAPILCACYKRHTGTIPYFANSFTSFTTLPSL